jgi:hypothetical protein
MVSNKTTLILVSSLTTISLATLLLVASAFHRRKRKSPRTHGFLGQTRSTKGVDTTSSITYRQQLREKSQRRQPTPSQGAKTKAVTRTITNATASSKKDPTTTATIPSPIAPSSTSDSSAIVSPQTPKEEEISVSDEARKAGESLKELIITAIKEAKDSAKGTGKRLKEQTVDIASTVDSKDVRSLGDNVKASVQLFEEIMIEIRKERYDEQIKLLDGYKDLLQTHIKVLDTRGRMASKLKPGA